jgi:hypothetical protein
MGMKQNITCYTPLDFRVTTNICRDQINRVLCETEQMGSKAGLDIEAALVADDFELLPDGLSGQFGPPTSAGHTPTFD